MKWSTIADAWNDENDVKVPTVSGNDLHALAVLVTGEASPSGSTEVSEALIRDVAGGVVPAYDEGWTDVVDCGDADEAARWVVKNVL